MSTSAEVIQGALQANDDRIAAYEGQSINEILENMQGKDGTVEVSQ